jgi:hypothetical protein
MFTSAQSIAGVIPYSFVKGYRCQVSGVRFEKSEISVGQDLNTDT